MFLVAATSTWVVPSGIYAILIGASSRDMRLQQKVMVYGAPRQTCLPDQSGWYAHYE